MEAPRGWHLKRGLLLFVQAVVRDVSREAAAIAPSVQERQGVLPHA